MAKRATGKTISKLEGMAKDSIVFALANPVPEIMPDDVPGSVRVVATGRSDFPNQINNVLVFPGFFRGLLDAKARSIDDEMKIAAARALAGLVGDDELTEDYIIPSPFDDRVVPAVSEAVRLAADPNGHGRIGGAAHLRLVTAVAARLGRQQVSAPELERHAQTALAAAGHAQDRDAHDPGLHGQCKRTRSRLLREHHRAGGRRGKAGIVRRRDLPTRDRRRRGSDRRGRRRRGRATRRAGDTPEERDDDDDARRARRERGDRGAEPQIEQTATSVPPP